jgi:hypothetical protein
MPDTWLPTWTEVTGLIVPVAETIETRLPRSTDAVRYRTGGLRSPRKKTYPPMAKATATTAMIQATLRKGPTVRIRIEGNVKAGRSFYRFSWGCAKHTI